MATISAFFSSAALIVMFLALTCSCFGGATNQVTLFGMPTPTFAASINNKGEVVGWIETQPNDPGTVAAFLYTGGKVVQLPKRPGWDTSIAIAINDASQVAGYGVSMFGQTLESFLYDKGVLINILTQNESSYVVDINQPGQVLGSINSTSFVYHDGIVKYLPFDLPTGLNDQGVIIAQRMFPATGGGVIYTEGGMTNLDFYPQSINNQNQIIGYGFVDIEGRRYEYSALYQNGNSTDLNATVRIPSPWDIAPIAINNRGAIVANAFARNRSSYVRFQTRDGLKLTYVLFQDGFTVPLNRLVPAVDGVVLRPTALNDRSQITGYRAYVTDNSSSFAGGAFVLTLNPLPQIVVQPESQVVTRGGTATFDVGAIAPQEISYQWRLNGAPLLGATNSRLAMTNIGPGQAGNYTVEIKNEAGVIVSSPASLVVGSCVPAPIGMVAWWPGDGNSQDIQSTNHGQLKTRATYAVGKVGSAFYFRGNNDFLEVTNSGGLNFSNQLSIVVWIKPLTAGLDDRIVDKITPGGADGFLLDLFRGLRFLVADKALYGPAPGLESWSHVAAVFDGSEMRLYINAVLSGRLAAPGLLIPSNNHLLRIGAGQGSAPDSFHGLIDELAIFGRTLSQNEIETIYAAGGRMCKQPEITGFSLESTNEIHLNLMGKTGHSFIVETSSNLVDWVSARTLESPFGTNVFIDRNISHDSQRFYRLRQ